MCVCETQWIHVSTSTGIYKEGRNRTLLSLSVSLFKVWFKVCVCFYTNTDLVLLVKPQKTIYKTVYLCLYSLTRFVTRFIGYLL